MHLQDDNKSFVKTAKVKKLYKLLNQDSTQAKKRNKIFVVFSFSLKNDN